MNMLRGLAVLWLAALVGCGSAPALVVVNEPTAEGRVRVSVESLELKEPSLPGYALADEIPLESASGLLNSVDAVLWADKPARAISLELTRHLSALTRIRVAPAPWPFENQPVGVLDLRFETLLARSDGRFHASGQYFLGRLDGGRERSGLFELSEPIAQPATAQTISEARGRVIKALANLLARDALR
jgi:uncharacterized lipoprotein YmbA